MAKAPRPTTRKGRERKTASTERLIERFSTDFEFFAPRVLKIRPKNPKPGQGVIPLNPNQAQRIFLDRVLKQLAERGYVRVVVLKGRQQGLSTIIEAIGYWWTSRHDGIRALVVAHEKGASKTLFQMARRYHQHCPTVLKPHTAYSSRTELVFDERESSIFVGTASGDGLGRSETIQFLHASELA